MGKDIWMIDQELITAEAADEGVWRWWGYTVLFLLIYVFEIF